MPLLEVDGVSRTFGGVAAVDAVSFAVEPGEWVGLIGPNGAGKSTLFNVLGGQVKASTGRVLLREREITRLTAHRRYRAGISRSFQISSLFHALTVREHLTIACRDQHRWNLVRGWRTDRQINAQVDRLIEQWDLDIDLDALTPAAMSYGEQRRLELAIAVASRPRLLLLDEPNVGLTAQECDMLRDRVNELGPETTVVFVAHDMNMVMGWSHRILVMHQGRLVADDTPDRIATNKFVEEVYLGAESQPAGDV